MMPKPYVRLKKQEYLTLLYKYFKIGWKSKLNSKTLKLRNWLSNSK